MIQKLRCVDDLAWIIAGLHVLGVITPRGGTWEKRSEKEMEWSDRGVLGNDRKVIEGY